MRPQLSLRLGEIRQRLEQSVQGEFRRNYLELHNRCPGSNRWGRAVPRPGSQPGGDRGGGHKKHWPAAGRAGELPALPGPHYPAVLLQAVLLRSLSSDPPSAPWATRLTHPVPHCLLAALPLHASFSSARTQAALRSVTDPAFLHPPH